MEGASVQVVDIEDVGPDAFVLVLETPAEFEARPGQFVKLLMEVDGEEHSRFYTISSPDVTETFDLTIEVDPDGEVSPRLRELDAGARVTLSGPFGNAYYEDESSVVVLAGGPGIGPAVGITERTLQDGGEAAIVYRDDEPIHSERLDELNESGAFVRMLDADEDLTDSLTETGIEDTQVFVYGFVDFLDDAMDAIAAAGGEPDRAKVENFG